MCQGAPEGGEFSLQPNRTPGDLTAEGWLIKETPCWDVWLERRPVQHSVKVVPESIRATAPDWGSFWTFCVAGDFKAE